MGDRREWPGGDGPRDRKLGERLVSGVAWRGAAAHEGTEEESLGRAVGQICHGGQYTALIALWGTMEERKKKKTKK
jgi:hypothetical protein